MLDIDCNLLSGKDHMTILELSRLLCVPEPMIVEWIEHEVVCAKIEKNTYYISSTEISKAKCAVRLTRDLGVNASGISIILQLRRKIQELEAVVSQQ